MTSPFSWGATTDRSRLRRARRVRRGGEGVLPRLQQNRRVATGGSRSRAASALPNEEERPERIFEDFLIGKPAAEARLQALARGVRPALVLVFDQAEFVREG
jgi:hypothetical protein